MNISIIIPNYNGEKVLEKNLPKVLHAVEEYKKGYVEIIIPDDASSDRSREIIQTFIKGIKGKHIIGKTINNDNKRGRGFSRNINSGVSIATGDILLLLNSDTAPREGFLEPLLKHFAHDTVFGVACMDESRESGTIVLRGRGVGKWKRGFLMHNAGNLEKNNTLWLSGGSSAFRKTLWDKLRGLDMLYNPFYWEDIDLSYRALKSGYETIFEKESIVVHEHEEGAIKTKFKSDFVKKIAYRNQFIFVWKNITDINLLINHVLWLPYHFVRALLARDTVFFSGFFLAVMKFPEITRSRTKAKKLFTKTDTEVIHAHEE